jgi:hypothetical protein
MVYRFVLSAEALEAGYGKNPIEWMPSHSNAVLDAICSEARQQTAYKLRRSLGSTRGGLVRKSNTIIVLMAVLLFAGRRSRFSLMAPSSTAAGRRHRGMLPS